MKRAFSMRCVFFPSMVVIAFVVLSGCEQKIDFVNDVPQRAQGISRQQTQKIRTAQEVPALKQKYREYSAKPAPKSLAQLRNEKKALEKKISQLVQQQNVGICSICKKKYHIEPLSKAPKKRRISFKPHKVKISKKKQTNAGRNQQTQENARMGMQNVQNGQNVQNMQNGMNIPMEQAMAPNGGMQNNGMGMFQQPFEGQPQPMMYGDNGMMRDNFGQPFVPQSFDQAAMNGAGGMEAQNMQGMQNMQSMPNVQNMQMMPNQPQQMPVLPQQGMPAVF